MGYACTSMILAELRLERSDLESKILTIQKTETSLTESTREIVTASTDLDSKSPTYNTLKQRETRLKEIENKLNKQLTDYQEDLKVTETRIESTEQLLNSQMKRTFAISYGGLSGQG